MLFGPPRRGDFLSWGMAKAEVWSEHAAAIGLTAEQAAAFGAAVAEVRDALTRQEQAIGAARASTEAAQAAVDTARALGADAVRRIRLFAASTGNPEVYQLAQVPPVAAQSPAAPPGTPTEFTIALENTGAVTISFKCRNTPSGGVTYLVRRAVGESGVFALVGSTGRRMFTDETVPAGAGVVMYTVQAQRGGKVGAVSAPIIVNLGVSAPAAGASGAIIGAVSGANAVGSGRAAA